MNTAQASEAGLGRTLLFAAVAIGLFLRLYGVHFGLPYLYHADEPIVVNHALAYGSGDLNPHFFKIPPLLSYLLFAFYGLSFLAGKIAGFFSSTADFENLFFKDPSYFYLSGRVLAGVLPGTLSVVFIYRLVKKHFSENAASLSALFLSVCFLHVRDSHYIYPDIILVLLLILIFDRALQVLAAPSDLRLHLASGVLIGLACAFKYNGSFFAVPYAAAVFLSRDPKAFKYSFLAAASSILIFLLLNPYAVFDKAAFLQDVRAQAKAQLGTPWTHHFRYSLWEGAGPAAVCFALAGMAGAFIRFDKKKCLFAIFAAAYYIVLVKAGQFYDRYALPLLVPVLFFAADTIVKISGSKKTDARRLVLLAALVILPNLFQSFLFGRIMAAKDIRTQAKEWVEENIPAGSGIALGWEFFLPRLQFSKEQLLEKKDGLAASADFSASRMRRLDFYIQNPPDRAYRLFFLREDAGSAGESRTLFAAPTIAYDWSELERRGIDYILLPRVSREPQPGEFIHELETRAELIHKITPYNDSGLEGPLDVQPLTGGPFLWKDLAARDRNGVAIEIYKLKRV